jgi:hypothetical protein
MATCMMIMCHDPSGSSPTLTLWNEKGRQTESPHQPGSAQQQRVQRRCATFCWE